MIKQQFPQLPSLIYAAQILNPGLNLTTLLSRAIFSKYGHYSLESCDDTAIAAALKAFIVK